VLPRTNGTAVVWQDFTNNPVWGISLYDLLQGPSGAPDPILANPAYDQKNPDISGDYIVYENWSGGRSDIYLYFGSNHTAVRISAFSNDDLNPSVDGTRVVWQRTNETTGYTAVYLYDLATGETRQLTPPGAVFNQVNPRISGAIVVVQDDRMGGAAQVYAYRLTASPPTEQWITSGSASMKINPAVSGNRVVWEDYRNGIGDDSDVYLNTLGAPETCPLADFSINPSAVLQGDTVTFTAAGAQDGASPVTHNSWNFSDGSPWELLPGSTALHAFSTDGVFLVKLTAGNSKCRNVSVETCSHKVFVNSPPAADFIATPEYGLAPLNIQFTDISCGIPRNWSWDFGDGNTSLEKNPSNVFVQPNREYTVSLTVNNTDAGYATSSRSKTVRTLMGGQNTADTPVDGITVDSRFGGQFLTYDSIVLPAHSPAPPAPYLVVYPPPAYGWENITFIASDSIGVVPPSPNQTYFANVSRFFLKTNDIIATTSGTPPIIGNNWGTSYQLNTTRYPQATTLRTEMWEGAVPPDLTDFDNTASNATTPNTLRSVAYTVKITKPRLAGEGAPTINMSVGSSWVATTTNIYVLGVGLNAAGDKIGAIMPATHLFSSGGLDYYEAEIPENANYLSKFCLADLSGSGNPLQLITLSVTSHVNPPAPELPSADSDSGMPGGGGGGIAPAKVIIPTTIPTPTPTQQPPDPGTSAKVYTNAQGVVSQATRLVSTDGRAVVVLGEGITALDAAGKPLEQITMKAIPAGSLPPVPSGSAFSFGGMAYEIGPDGATFSQPLSLAFMLSQAQWGLDYTVRSFDHKTGSWVDLPTTMDAATGTVTVEVSHLCCFALFTRPITAPLTPVATPLPVPAAPQVKAQPPATAVSIFMSMLGWIADLMVNNIIPFVAFIFLGIAGYLVMQGRFPGSGQ
jgi:beta propeller repeat protein